MPIDDYVRVGDHFEIDLHTAFRRNHMCLLLNDQMLGVKPPLEFRLTCRRYQTRMMQRKLDMSLKRMGRTSRH